MINRESSVNSKNPIKRRILRRAKDSEKLSKHTNPDRAKYSNDWKDVKEVIKSNVSQLFDESLASKNGLKLLKDLGLSKEELKRAKKNLKHGYNTYKYNNHAAIKMSLSGKILPKEYRPVPGRLKERRRWN